MKTSLRGRVLYAALLVFAVGCTSVSQGGTSEIPAVSTQTLTQVPVDTPVVTTTPVLNEKEYGVVVDEYGHHMVLIPSGTVMLGLTREQADIYCSMSPISDCGLEPELEKFPSQTMTVEHSFWIDVFEVSNEQYDTCVAAGICQRPPYGFNNNLEYYFEEHTYDNYPVSAMTYQDAVAYCEEWRGARLPTELEWEYAARGSDGRLWPWGNSVEPGGDFGDFMNSYTIGEGAAIGFPQPADAYPSGVSPFGVYNMTGNVEEWVAIEDRLYPPETETELEYVVRGGFFSSTVLLASTFYSRSTDQNSHFETGFRCARDVEE